MFKLSSGSFPTRAQLNSIGAAPVHANVSATNCACFLPLNFFTSISFALQLLDLSSNRPVTPAPESWLSQLRITRDKTAISRNGSGMAREQDLVCALPCDSSNDLGSSTSSYDQITSNWVNDREDISSTTNNQFPHPRAAQPTLCPSPPPRAVVASTSALRSSRPLIPSKTPLNTSKNSSDSQILNLCCQLDSESSAGNVEAVVTQALQLLVAANKATDGSSVSEPMRRSLVKCVSSQMSTEDPERLLDFSSVLLAALQPGSSRNRTVVKVIYKVSKSSSNDLLFAARPQLLQLMAEVIQASSDHDTVL
jgi:hypothetical protein